MPGNIQITHLIYKHNKTPATTYLDKPQNAFRQSQSISLQIQAVLKVDCLMLVNLPQGWVKARDCWVRKYSREQPFTNQKMGSRGFFAPILGTPRSLRGVHTLLHTY
jgi:hypothetical protein